MAGYDFGAETPSAFTLEHRFRVLDTGRDTRRLPPTDRMASARPWAATRDGRVARRHGTAIGPACATASCSSRTSASIRTGSNGCSTSCTCSSRCRSAVVLGAFTEYRLFDHDDGYDLATVVQHLRARIEVPLYTGLPFGHVRDKLTLPVGGRATLAAWRAGHAARLRRDERNIHRSPSGDVAGGKRHCAPWAPLYYRRAGHPGRSRMGRRRRTPPLAFAAVDAQGAPTAGAPAARAQDRPHGGARRMARAGRRGRAARCIDRGSAAAGYAEPGTAFASLRCRSYSRAGFVCEGDAYDEVGIPHQTMRLRLRA